MEIKNMTRETNKPTEKLKVKMKENLRTETKGQRNGTYARKRGKKLKDQSNRTKSQTAGVSERLNSEKPREEIK